MRLPYIRLSQSRHFFTILLGVSALITGFGTFTIARWQATAEPRASVPTTFFDFGIRAKGDTMKTEIPVTNKGRKPLVLDQFIANCGCLNIEKKTKQGTVEIAQRETIEPGETLSLVAGMISGRGMASEVRWGKIAIRTNDPKNPSLLITMKVSLTGELVAFPQVLDFGRVTRGELPTERILLRDTGRLQQFDFAKVETSSPDLHVTVTPRKPQSEFATASKANVVGELRVTYQAKQQGVFQEKITLWEQNEKHASLIIPVNIAVGSTYRVEPSHLTLPRNSQKGPSYVGTVSIETTDREPFRLSIDKSPKNVQVDIEPAADPHRKLVKITVDPLTWKNRESLEIMLMTESGQKHESHTIKILGSKSL